VTNSSEGVVDFPNWNSYFLLVFEAFQMERVRDTKLGDRDRLKWSTGRMAPSLYLGLGFAGFFPLDEVALLRVKKGKRSISTWKAKR
jgi:transketolase N-terminal domain/subunit